MALKTRRGAYVGKDYSGKRIPWWLTLELLRKRKHFRKMKNFKNIYAQAMLGVDQRASLTTNGLKKLSVDHGLWQKRKREILLNRTQPFGSKKSWIYRSKLCTCFGLLKRTRRLLIAAIKQPNGQARGRTKRNLIVKEHRRGISFLVLPLNVHIQAWHLAVKSVLYCKQLGKCVLREHKFKDKRKFVDLAFY